MRNKTITFFIFILILSTMIALLKIIYSNRKAQKDFALKFYNTSIFSKIIAKEIDLKNHHARVIRFFDMYREQNWLIQINTDGLNFDELWEKSNEGDLILKLEKSLSIEIIKQDSSKVIVIVPDYDKYIQDNEEINLQNIK